jgi:hypothetical protein
MSRLQEVLQQEVTRKEFIQYVGLALLGMIGVTTFLQNFSKYVTHSTASTTAASQQKGAGYGMNSYGR